MRESSMLKMTDEEDEVRVHDEVEVVKAEPDSVPEIIRPDHHRCISLQRSMQEVL